MRSDLIATEYEHEQLTVFRDPETGVTGAIGIHSTALGPAMGGLRLFRYETLSDGIVDVLRLARAMSFKSAAAGLDLGGGKAILLDDGSWGQDREERMRVVGRAIESLGGRYITAEDVGTSPADMNAIAEVTRHVAGASADKGGFGDPSPYTAQTVFAAIECGVRAQLRRDSLEDVRVGVQGVGHVGALLVAMLADAGAEVFLADIDPQRADQVAAPLHRASVLPLEGFLYGEFDVIAPCALGGAIGLDQVPRLSTEIIAGAANNPLTHREVAAAVAVKGILYVPDFIANCGGIIHVGAEALGLDRGAAQALITNANARTEQLLAEAVESGRLPLEVAEEYALERIHRRREPAV